MKKLSQFNEGLNSYKNIIFCLKRKSKWNLSIKINSKNEIIVLTPLNISDNLLIQFLDKNLIKFNDYLIEKQKNNWINMEECWFYLLGSKISFIYNSNAKNVVINEEIKMNCKSEEQILEQINKYRKKILLSYLNISQKKFQELMKVPDHEIKIRNKNSAWATNHIQKKVIFYSINLASFSREIIDYVIVHELSHHVHNNHSKNFWNNVQKYDPDFKLKKFKLKKYEYY